ncbi:amidohydrolase family protein [Rhodococcus globerulus]|uniref:Amidohydrolase family protein n=1 Tax=Rhodococcus globerulus TaxID=33008 RepID=A0ABU4C5J8_RHOGO|nr:amidohydrolase family protein [Rhodococcus globerulus]MDV6271463.1 amidohydrolase family protein [Rhodococcus globerulus]
MTSAPSIDTHAHVFRRGLTLSATRRYTPSYDSDVDAYLAQLDANGLTRGVLVQPSFLGTDNSFMLDALAEHPDRLRGVVVIDPNDDHDVDKLHAQGARGIRLNLIGAGIPDLERPEWRNLERRIGQLGWHLEIQAKGDQWDRLASRISAWRTPVVIDHLGLPAVEDPRAVEVIIGLGALDHVWTKVSAPYRSSNPTPTLARYLDLYGTRNLLFGTDWPFTGHEEGRSMGAQIAWARSVLGDQAFDVTLPRNAQRLLDWN